MVIPENVNFIEFYYKAKEKGIKVNSRYKGVAIIPANRGIAFAAICQGKYVGHFPLTKEGEIKAHQMYLRKLECSTLDKRGRHSNKVDLSKESPIELPTAQVSDTTDDAQRFTAGNQKTPKS